MFYLMSHSTHFIYDMVKDHIGSGGNLLLPLHGLFFPEQQQGIFYMHCPTNRTDHIKAFVTPVAGMRNSSMDPPCRIDPMTLYTMELPCSFYQLFLRKIIIPLFWP